MDPTDGAKAKINLEPKQDKQRTSISDRLVEQQLAHDIVGEKDCPD